MAPVPYAVQELAQTLKAARIARGLSQRELAAAANLGAKRLVPIEAGSVDLRVSTLIQLARALDLELVLAPRNILPAVQTLTAQPRQASAAAAFQSIRTSTPYLLRHIQTHLDHLKQAHEANPVFQQMVQTLGPIQRHAEDLGAPLQPHLQQVRRHLGQARRSASDQPAVQRSLEQANRFLQRAALLHGEHLTSHSMELARAPQAQRGAFSLGDESS